MSLSCKELGHAYGFQLVVINHRPICRRYWSGLFFSTV